MEAKSDGVDSLKAKERSGKDTLCHQIEAIQTSYVNADGTFIPENDNCVVDGFLAASGSNHRDCESFISNVKKCILINHSSTLLDIGYKIIAILDIRPHLVNLVELCSLSGVLYNYGYIIGYSIDDLEGIKGAFLFWNICDVKIGLHVDIPWDPGGQSFRHVFMSNTLLGLHPGTREKKLGPY
ncbi:hypothetical protein BAE44_0000618 [Dichanthelium oligosanthes]|uniref:Uncharacterized protein n=1 Tax=Dichanthelium oligosanthes TaxID=888268 RepID=A0A1E5WLY2_9POAL|nr:hypothetical protein BAE44_0000618 [Dichanthelium oligosanthes]